MCGAIDTTLSAISSGIVHSRVGACDSRGLFAKCVLHDDSHHTLGITSLRPFMFHFRIPKNLSRRQQLLMASRVRLCS
jgi:hypothetical protein